MTLLFGPILQFRGLLNQHWRISALFGIPIEASLPDVASNGELVLEHCKFITQIPFNNPRYNVYRLDFSLPKQLSTGEFTLDGSAYNFFTPGATESPRIAYVSCNGFSEPKLIKAFDNKHGRWQDLYAKHQTNPYHILIMGGNQIHTDEMWRKISALDKWTNLPFAKRINTAFTQEMQKRLDEQFCQHYIDRWNQIEIAQTLAAIPSIMMWNDHDSIDGWGSYPTELHNSDVFQGIFQMAKQYFRVFQLQLAEDERHPCQIAEQEAFNFGFDGIGDIGLLVLDLCTERQPEPSQIMSVQTWDAIFRWLDQQQFEHLFVVSSIPLAYLDLGTLERKLGVLPQHHNLNAHWRSVAQAQERKRLIYNLFKFAHKASVRVTALSGNVHVGALAVIESQRHVCASNVNVINQLISSGVVHPAPNAIELYVFESIADTVEPIDRGITGSMQRLGNQGNYLLGARNWLGLEPDGSGRIWANWYVEGEHDPVTKVIHPPL